MAKKQSQADTIARAIELLAPFQGGRVFEARELLKSIRMPSTIAATVKATSPEKIGREYLGYGWETVSVYRLSEQTGESTACALCTRPIRLARACNVDSYVKSGAKSVRTTKVLAHLGCRQGQVREWIWNDAAKIERARLLGAAKPIDVDGLSYCTGCEHHAAEHKDDRAGNPNMDCSVHSCDCDHFQSDADKLDARARKPMLIEAIGAMRAIYSGKVDSVNGAIDDDDPVCARHAEYNPSCSFCQAELGAKTARDVEYDRQHEAESIAD